MAKFLALIVIFVYVVGSVHCCRPISWKMLPLPPPSPSFNDKGCPISPPPSSYNHGNTSISPSPTFATNDVPSMSPLPSPSSYDNRGPTSHPLVSSNQVWPPSLPPSTDNSGKQKNQTQNQMPSPPSHISDQNLYNVLNYGAKGNDHDDESQAFKNAWDDACRSPSSSGVYIPSGRTYKLMPMTLSGPCNSDITVQIDGELIAPEEPSEWGCSRCHTWIMFDRVNSLTIQGSGAFNGRGTDWWRKSFCSEAGDITDCRKKPTALYISQSNNVYLRDLMFKDSPQMHIVIGHSTYVYVNNVAIHAPGDSPNTDGIHIQNSEHVYVSDCDIGTGDDCISISNGSSDINVEGIRCGPGHGISIGSLGKHGAEDRVENVHVKDVEFRGSTNGARIKTWQGGRGYAKNIVFDDITCDRVRNPIIITQFYCDHELCTTHPSAVHISNVTYSNIKGTSYTERAIELECSSSHPCTDIVLKDIDLRWTRKERETLSSCSNVQGLRNGNVSPMVSCLELSYIH